MTSFIAAVFQANTLAKDVPSAAKITLLPAVSRAELCSYAVT